MAGSVAETLIGAVVLVAAGGFMAYTAQTTDIGVGAGNYQITAQFRQVNGLNIGGDVRISGVKVGAVSELSLDPATYYANVTLSIRSGVEIPTDSSAKISTDGLLGGAYVAIEPGGAEEMLAAGAEVEFTQGSVNILDLVSKAIAGVGG